MVYLAMRACLLHTPQARIAVNVKPLLYSAATFVLPYRARIKRDKNTDVDMYGDAPDSGEGLTCSVRGLTRRIDDLSEM